MSCLYTRTPFLMDRPLVLFRTGPNTPTLWASLFLAYRYEATRSALYQGSPPDNGRCRPNELAPRTAVLVGSWDCTYRSLRRASRCSSRRWITRMLGRVHVYTYTCQTPWLIAGSQSGSRYVGPASWLINMVVTKTLFTLLLLCPHEKPYMWQSFRW